MFVILLLISIAFFIYFINDLRPLFEFSTSTEIPNATEAVNEVVNNDITVSNNQIIELKDSNIINAPLILQYPELPRGCEVTSLAMLLQYSGNPVNKLKLANEIAKDNSYYITAYGRIFYGNPEHGFVGNMYSLKEPGLGVYHKPIFDLLSKYLPDQAIDLTGRKFEDTLYFLSNDVPVWVITNTKFKELSPDDFHIWYTSTIPIQVTYFEHSVLLTGYDQQYIYFNDPLSKEKNQKAPIEDFKKSWEQMGKQSVSYIPSDKKQLFELFK